MSVRRIELGCAGHFIVASQCAFRRHTQVGNYRVSTVGDYIPSGKHEREQIGAGRFFETMVFKTKDAPSGENEGCGCREVVGWAELECDGYQTAGEAQDGHERMVRKYQRKQR